MKKIVLWALGLLSVMAGCQTESLDIQRSFPFKLAMDAFPSSIKLYQPTSVGFGLKPDYLTTGNAYTFSWQIAAPQRGVMVLNNRVIAPGSKAVVFGNTGKLFTDTLTYVPSDSGAHLLTLRFFDTTGQQKDTSITITAVH